MSFISSLLAPFKWLASKITSGVKTAAPIAVTITEAVKTILSNPVTGFLENIADSVTGTNLPTALANDVIAIIHKVLAAELAIEGLPDNPTQAQVTTFEQAVLKAFNVSADNSRLYTVLGAQIYALVNTTATSGTPVTFAVLVADVEAAYQDYQADLAANAPVQSSSINNTGSGNVVANGNIPTPSPAISFAGGVIEAPISQNSGITTT